MDRLPKICIITPNYNGARFLEENILSVIGQNYPNLEYIIIDGGSTDGSVDIIKKYEKYLTYWVSEPDKGHGHALNKGFAKTTGEIMAWLNSDDKYYPYTFQTVAEIFNKFSDISWIQGKNSWIDKSGRLMDVDFSLINIYSYLLNDYKWIQQESVFWRRSLWDQAGSFIDESMTLMVDGELWTRFFLFDDLWHFNLVLGSFRTHDNNRSNSKIDEVYYEMEKAIELMRNKISPEHVKVFNSLKDYLGLKQRIESAEIPIQNVKFFRLLPHFLYKRIINKYIMDRITRINLDKDLYNYKMLELKNERWEKDSRKFKYLE